MSNEHSSAHPADELLIAFALDELAEDDRGKISSHVDGCEVCRGTVVSLEAALECVRDAPARDAPAQVLVDLLEEQAAGRARTSLGRRLLSPLPLAAAAALLATLFFTGFWAGRQTAPDPAGLPPNAERSAPRAHPLPDPPEIPFQTAMSGEGWPADGVIDR